VPVGGSVRGDASVRSRPADDVADRDRLFGAFAAALAIALVLDQLWWGGFEVASPRALVVAAGRRRRRGPAADPGPLPPVPTLAERVALFRPLVPPGAPRC
jgi:hypothetical protein